MSIRPVVHVMGTLLENFPLSILVELVFKAEFDEQYGCRFITLKYIYSKIKNGSVEKGTRKKEKY